MLGNKEKRWERVMISVSGRAAQHWRCKISYACSKRHDARRRASVGWWYQTNVEDEDIICRADATSQHVFGRHAVVASPLWLRNRGRRGRESKFMAAGSEIEAAV